MLNFRSMALFCFLNLIMAGAFSSPVAGDFDKGYLVFKSEDGNYTWKLDGRIMMDAGSASTDKNKAYANMDFRRARLGIKTSVYKKWSGEFDLDFSGNESSVKDMWMAYRLNEHIYFKAGNHKPFFSMAELTTSRWYTFLETSMVTDSIATGRRIGFSAAYEGENLFIGATIFGEKLGVDNEDAQASEEFGHSARVVYRPYINIDAGQFFHIGLDYLHQGAQSEDENGEFEIKSGVETSVIGLNFLNTGSIENTDQVNTMGLEMAGKMSSVSMQAEYYTTKLEADNDYDFSGYYIDLSYMLTGESRPYNTGDAEFGAVMPSSENGDLELALRLSTLDLNDGVIQGGKSDAITIALNWYVNTNVVIRSNYIVADFDDMADDDGDLVGGDEVTVMSVRFQYYF